MKKTVSSASPLEKSIGFSRACRIDSTIAVSGTAPLSSDGETTCKGDVYGQTKRCLEISLNAIEEAGGSITGVIRTRIMLTDITLRFDLQPTHITRWLCEQTGSDPFLHFFV